MLLRVKTHRINFYCIHIRYELDAPLGLEPRLYEPKSHVLPLDEGATTMEEDVGFEPTDPFLESAVFKTAALNQLRQSSS